MTGSVDLIMSTFSKSLASLGGFVAGDEDVIHYIKHHARSLIFSASIPAPNAAAVLAALQVMREEPERIQRVNDIGARMRTELRRMGYNIGNSQTPVIPLLIGDDMCTLYSWKALFDAGIFVNPVLSPGVPDGRQLLRTSYMASHTDAQIDRALELFHKVGKQMGLI
jgi:7-keto-8-aminopelargonate synthetase-like enzyme